MGIDAPCPCCQRSASLCSDILSSFSLRLTNPPIDAIREEIVTSTTIYIGKDGNLLEKKEENCKMLRVNNPILTNTDLLKIKNMM